MRDQAEEIFAELLDVDPAYRRDYIPGLCGGDAALQAEVEDLLRDADRADTFFEAFTLGAPGLPSRPSSPPADKPGEVIGAYHLIRLLGRGGFGSVWLAGQTLPLRRQVALKIIKRGMDSEDVLARFRAEQQALAMMNHPHIARVFDAGIAPDGRPYFAMELVEGKKVTAYCDAHSLSIPERLRLFLQICSAVNHAHQRGIIHRDLKPSNILVTCKDGEAIAKVIDFGIARAIEGSISGDGTLTRADQFVGTPAYMSPEQAAGRKDAIDTRTDVYSLGIILYELLVGSVPFDEKTLAAAGREQICHIIREEDPARPSTKLQNLTPDERTGVAAVRNATPDLLPKLIMAELDWIAMKAIDKSRDRRYETTDALAADVQHYLNNEPVTARPPSTAYILGKMARRHRTLLASATSIALILCMATAASLWLAIRAKRAESLASERLHQVLDEQSAKEKARQQAEEVSSFIVDLFRKPHPDRDGRNVTAAEVLLGAEKNISTKLADQPARAILLKRTLADTYYGLGLYPEALRLRNDVYKEGRSLLSEASSEALNDLSVLADLQFQLGYYKEALGSFQQEVELRKKQSPQNPKSLKRAEDGVIDCLFRTGEHEQSRKLRQLQESQQPPPSPPPPPPPQATATKPEPAPPQTPELKEAQRRQDVQNIMKTAREYSNRPRLDPAVLNWMARASDNLFGLGEGKSGVEMQYDLVNRLEEKYGDNHMATIEAYEQLTYLISRTGYRTKELPSFQDISERRRRLFGPERLQTILAEAKEAEVMFIYGKTTEALKDFERLIPLLNKVDGRKGGTLHAEGYFARCLLAEGRTAEAMQILKNNVPRMTGDSFIAFILAQLLVWQSHIDEYRKLRDASIAYAWRERIYTDRRPDIPERLALLASLLPFDNDDQAKKIREIIRIDKLCHDVSTIPELENNNYQYAIYGIVAYRLGDYDEARYYLEMVPLVSHNRLFKMGNANAARLFLAMTVAKQGDMIRAARIYTNALRYISDPPSQEDPLIKRNRPGGDEDYLLSLIARREAAEVFKAPPLRP